MGRVAGISWAGIGWAGPEEPERRLGVDGVGERDGVEWGWASTDLPPSTGRVGWWLAGWLAGRRALGG